MLIINDKLICFGARGQNHMKGQKTKQTKETRRKAV